jgi:DNA polymerase-1
MKYGFEPTLEEATQFHSTFFDLYRALPAWHERQIKLAQQDGFVRSMSGRKRRLPGTYSQDRSIVSECERQAINAPVQGYIGDHKAMILVELHEAFSRDYLRIVGEVHDSILMWIRHDHLSILSEVKERAENPQLVAECGLKFPIKLSVDLEIGPWGAGRRYQS